MCAVKRSVTLLYDSPYDDQTHKIAPQLIAQKFPKTKATFYRKNCFLGRKTSKNWVCRGLQVCTKKLHRILLVQLRLYPNSQVSGPSRITRCCNKKTDNFMGKKLRFGPKKLQKGSFSGFSDIATLNISVVSLRFSEYAQTYRIAGYFKWKVGKQKLRHKRVFYLFLHLPVFQGLARVDFGSVLIQITFLY